LVNPVTFLPSTSGLPEGALTWRRTPGAWQTSATGLPAAMNCSISLIESGSSARSHIGPWLAFGIAILFEATCDVSLEAGILAFWIKRWTATLGRGQCDP